MAGIPIENVRKVKESEEPPYKCPNCQEMFDTSRWELELTSKKPVKNTSGYELFESFICPCENGKLLFRKTVYTGYSGFCL
jgi:hypothetical protein